MKVLMVEPGKSPYETEIEGGLESLQAAVGGDIQATYPFDVLVGLICNDEGKLLGMPLNRAMRQIVHRGPWNESNPEKYLIELQIPLEHT